MKYRNSLTTKKFYFVYNYIPSTTKIDIYAHLVFLFARDVRETLASVHSYLEDTVIYAEIFSVAAT